MIYAYNYNKLCTSPQLKDKHGVKRRAAHEQTFKRLVCKRMHAERMSEWLSEWMNEWMNEWVNELVDEWVNELVDEWANELMNEFSNPF